MWKVYILHHSYWDWLASAWRCHMWQSWKFSQREIKSLFLVLVVNKFCPISNFMKLQTLTLAACSYVLLVLYACHPKHFYFVLQCEGTRWERGSRLISWYLSRLNSLAGSLYGTTCLVPTATLLPDSILLASRFEFAEYLLPWQQFSHSSHSGGDKRLCYLYGWSSTSACWSVML